MPITTQSLERIFVYNGQTLPDPNPSLGVEAVRDVYLTTYPEMTTATVSGPDIVDGKIKYTFTRAVGAKG